MAQFNKNTNLYLGDNKTLFEVVMLADQYGNRVGPANPSGTAVDAFGRARSSQPLTLFDSSHRFSDNGLWATATSGTASASFVANEGVIDLTVNAASGASVIRETKKVFAYQPGKSLLILSTFVFNAAKENLRQRVGYFGAQNGIYLELDGSTLNLVRRSYVSGTLLETRVPQANWNVDTLQGTGPSLLTLDISKAQIMFLDIEWLGLGTVRCGFVINGQLVHCHSFHHANLVSTTYITTACLPVRYEITNTGATTGSSTMKQICTSVISEGGYELRGQQRAVGTPLGSPRALSVIGTLYPVMSVQLKSTRLDSIVIPNAISVLGVGNNTRIEWRLITGATLTSPSWQAGDASSSVEYDLSATGYTGGTVLASGFIGITNQSAQSLDILKDALFKFQLERNGLTSTPVPLTIAVAGGSTGDTALVSLTWEEITK